MIYDKMELEDMAMCYYLNFYTGDPMCGGSFISGCFPRLSPEAKFALNVDYSSGDIYKALQSMGVTPCAQ